MSTQKRLPMKKIVLAMALAGYAYGAAWAGSTGTTPTIIGDDAGVWHKPGVGNAGVAGVDFSFVTQANDGYITPGDEIKLKYFHSDDDADADGTSVTWHYYNAAGVSVGTATGTTPVPGQEYSLTIPAAATLPVGTHHIGAIVVGKSATGDPRDTVTVTIPNIALPGGNPGGGELPDVDAGGGGQVITGAPVGGIFLASAGMAAGGSAVNYSHTSNTTAPKVGQEFELKVWADDNSDGIWSTGEADLTDTVTASNVTWKLGGMAPSAAADGVGALAAADAATGVLTYEIPVNTSSSSGKAWGDQGYTLEVTW